MATTHGGRTEEERLLEFLRVPADNRSQEFPTIKKLVKQGITADFLEKNQLEKCPDELELKAALDVLPLKKTEGPIDLNALWILIAKRQLRIFFTKYDIPLENYITLWTSNQMHLYLRTLLQASDLSTLTKSLDKAFSTPQLIAFESGVREERKRFLEEERIINPKQISTKKENNLRAVFEKYGIDPPLADTLTNAGIKLHQIFDYPRLPIIENILSAAVTVGDRAMLDLAFRIEENLANTSKEELIMRGLYVGEKPGIKSKPDLKSKEEKKEHKALREDKSKAEAGAKVAVKATSPAPVTPPPPASKISIPVSTPAKTMSTKGASPTPIPIASSGPPGGLGFGPPTKTAEPKLAGTGKTSASSSQPSKTEAPPVKTSATKTVAPGISKMRELFEKSQELQNKSSAGPKKPPPSKPGISGKK